MGLGVEASPLISAANEILGTMASVGIQADDTLRENSVTFSDKAASILKATLLLPTAGATAFVTTREGISRTKLGAIRSLAQTTINHVQSKWFGSGLNDELAKVNPSLASQVRTRFDQLAARVSKLIDAESAWRMDLPGSTLTRGVETFFATTRKQIEKLASILDAILDATGRIAAAIGGLPTWLLISGIAAIAIALIKK